MRLLTQPPRGRKPLLARIIPPVPTCPARSNPTADGPAGSIPVVALHGTLDSPGAWAPLADALRAHNRNVFTPAYGARGTAPIADSVFEVEEFISQLGSGSDAEAGIPCVDVVGHSQGGLIAFLLCARQRLRAYGAVKDSTKSPRSGRELTNTPAIRFRRVISLSGSIGGVRLSGVACAAAWHGGALAKTLFGQALADQLTIANGTYSFDQLLPASSATSATGTLPATSSVTLSQTPEWISLISQHDRLVIPWSDMAQRYFPDNRRILLDNELAGRIVPHQRQQTDPEVISLLTRLLLAPRRG